MQHFMKSIPSKNNSNRVFILFLRKQLLPMDQKAYAKDFQERYDNEFLQVK